MSQPDDMPPIPRAEVLRMMEELNNYVTGREPMTPEMKKLLDAALENQSDQIKLSFAALASVKMSRMARLAKAVDLCEEKITDPSYISQLKEDPEEMRRHYQLLRSAMGDDVEFLRSMVAAGAEEDGFSKQPKQQFNMFFGPGSSATLLPDGMTNDGRRQLKTLVDRLLSFAKNNGQLPERPPRRPEARFGPQEAPESDAGGGEPPGSEGSSELVQ